MSSSIASPSNALNNNKRSVDEALLKWMSTPPPSTRYNSLRAPEDDQEPAPEYPHYRTLSTFDDEDEFQRQPAPEQPTELLPDAVEHDPKPEPEPVPEPACGVAIGVDSVHPMQRTFPLAFKTTSELEAPWMSNPLKGPRLRKNVQPPFVLLLLDMSPSMSDLPFGGTLDDCAAHAVHELIDNLPQLVGDAAPDGEAPNVCIAGFSGSAGFESEDYLEYEMIGPRTSRAHLTLNKINDNTASLSDAAALDALIAKWKGHLKAIYNPETSEQHQSGHGTNFEDALNFGMRVVDIVANREGLKAPVDTHVVLMTDGAATVGMTNAAKIRNQLQTRIAQKEFFKLTEDDEKSNWYCDQPQWAAPLQFHALMMGSMANPTFLTKVMDGNGLIAYAKNPSEIAAGVETILKPLLNNTKGRMQLVVATAFVDANDTLLCDWTVTSHDGGALLSDNYTALFEARMPTFFRASGGVCPTQAELEKLSMRVAVFANPFLFEMFKTCDFEWKNDGNSKFVVAQLADQHELLSHQRIPLTLKGFFTTLVWNDKRDLLERDYHDAGNRDSLWSKDKFEVKDGLFHWVKQKHELSAAIAEGLGRDVHDLASAEKSMRHWEQIATASGHRSIAKRLCTSRKAARHDVEYRSLGEDNFTSSHYVFSKFSQAPSA